VVDFESISDLEKSKRFNYITGAALGVAKATTGAAAQGSGSSAVGAFIV